MNDKTANDIRKLKEFAKNLLIIGHEPCQTIPGVACQLAIESHKDAILGLIHRITTTLAEESK